MNRERKITIIEPVRQKIEITATEIPEKLRVAAYARVSTEQDEQQSSYEAQVDFYTRYIQSNPNWEFVAVFADEGITGTNTRKRDGFNLMIQKAMNGEIDLILTKSISRFARNTVDTLQTVRKLKAIGVEVIFEKENLHTLDPKSQVMLSQERGNAYHHELSRSGGKPIYQRKCPLGQAEKHAGRKSLAGVLPFPWLQKGARRQAGDRGGRGSYSPRYL